jgi:hypothetical protein
MCTVAMVPALLRELACFQAFSFPHKTFWFQDEKEASKRTANCFAMKRVFVKKS